MTNEFLRCLCQHVALYNRSDYIMKIVAVFETKNRFSELHAVVA